MSKFSLSVYLNAYADSHPSNNPGQNNFKWNRDLSSIIVNNPTSQSAQIAPGETRILFNGLRTLTQDSSTQYSIALKAGTTNTYVLSWVGGTQPAFRTPLAPIADPSAVVTVTKNGPLVSFASPGSFASFTGQLPGMTTDVTITADNLGTPGNSVTLHANGTSSINTLITNWNNAHPGNTITLTSGDGTQIPTSGTITLAGGAYGFSLGGVLPGMDILIGSPFGAANQGLFQVVSVDSGDAETFSVVNPTGTAETVGPLGSENGSSLQVWGSTGVQIDDTLTISGGFSTVTQGSYNITAVYANSLEFYSSAVLPSEGPITTEAITISSNAKTLVYIESDSALDVILNNVDIGQIEPFVIPSASLPSLPPKVIPGMFMLKGNILSLSVMNNGINPANIMFISVE